MQTFEQRVYVEHIPHNIEAVLGVDVGGTNCNFGIFQNVDGTLQLILSLHFKSKEITNFTELVKAVLAYLQEKYQISARHSCFAAAGVVSEHRDRCKPTNLDFVVDANDIIKNTSLECATIANDFEIIGHGLKLVAKDKLIQVKKGKPRKHGVRAIIGAGTGLGKCILQWHEKLGRSMPMPSEGGHADFSAQTQLELNLIKFIHKTETRKCNVSWEDILSGNGISRIYKFFCETNKNKPANKMLKDNGLHPDEIFANRTLDEHAFKTYQLYTILYARCAKNFALDCLALGGIYIAGGIASKNIELFKQPEFSKEFVNCCKQQQLLEDIPVYVITDYNVSLYGAAQFMLQEKTCV